MISIFLILVHLLPAPRAAAAEPQAFHFWAARKGPKNSLVTYCLEVGLSGGEAKEVANEKCGEKAAPGLSPIECDAEKPFGKTIHDIEELSGKILLADPGGGGTSGGGDPDGLAAATRTLGALKKAIELAGAGVYTEEQKKKLLAVAEKLQVLVVDRELAVKVKGEIQNSGAFSGWSDSKPYTLLSRGRWNKIENAIDREAFLHHELAVLAGFEKTGDYTTLTSKFEEFRRKSWKFRTEKAQICTAALFQLKKSPNGRNTPGAPIGAAPIVMDFLGAKSGIEKIGDVSETRDIKVLYVIDSAGYLRLMVVEADRTPKTSWVQNLANQRTLLEESVLINPHGDDLYSGTATKTVVFGSYFLSVACTNQ